MKGPGVSGARSRRERGPAVVSRTCGGCGKRYPCLRGSVAEQMGICLRCFERTVRFPRLCQRP